MDICKAFNWISHDMLITKMHAYGFSSKTWTLFYSYLKRHKQSIKINNLCSVFQSYQAFPKDQY